MPKDTNPLRRKSSNSPFASLARTKPNNSRKTSQADASTQLDDTGLTPSLAPEGVSQDPLTLIRHVQSQTFSPIPDRGAGLNSERISEILRFKAALPPIVSLAHLYAISASSTRTEREIAKFVASGTLRKITIPGRGRGGAAVGEGVVVITDWIARVNAETSLEDDIKQLYINLLTTPAYRASATIPASALSDKAERALIATGFLTSPSALSTNLGDLFSNPDASTSLASVSSAGSRAATGSLAAVGGLGAVHESGGGGSTLATKDTRSLSLGNGGGRKLTFALPATGAYLKLLVAARAHLLHLLKQLSPKYREATMDLLREKWDGNVPGDALSAQKRARGEWTGVLPGKTKRWKDFSGLRFEYVLDECVGSGLVEVFETGSVGLGVRGR